MASLSPLRLPLFAFRVHQVTKRMNHHSDEAGALGDASDSWPMLGLA